MFEAFCDPSDCGSLIDRESFLAFGVALTFFTVGWVGIIGSDDILCCFVVGNALTWDDWFRIRSEEDSFQEVIDMLLNSVSCIQAADEPSCGRLKLTSAGSLPVHWSGHPLE